MKSIKKAVFNTVFIFLIGGFGGLFINQTLLPYLAVLPIFSEIDFIRRANHGTTVINPVQEVVIQENTAIEDTVDKISSCLVVVENDSGEQASGFIVTSDGLIVAARDTSSVYKVYKDNQFWPAELVKEDLENNLILLRIRADNLPVVSFSDLESMRLGAQAILVGVKLEKDKLNYFVNLGIIRSVSESVLKINLSEESILANGSPLIDVQGQVIGLNLVDENGFIKTIPSTKLKEFLGL